METTPVSRSVLRPRRLATSSLDKGSIFSGFFGRIFCCWILLLRWPEDGGIARKASAVVEMEDANDNSKIVAVEGNFILEDLG
mmetsp:Transcript_9018/g.12936  ORF Transcript_9018/g.12936 Transcript_9018/m.12936 type:complete len:83 (-) Transcript_9018:203-451(-)